MIRPRGGNFVYSEDELNIMMLDIDTCKSIGISEIVTGVLTKDNKIDINNMKQILIRASPMSVVFHMAFDDIEDYDEGF